LWLIRWCRRQTHVSWEKGLITKPEPQLKTQAVVSAPQDPRIEFVDGLRAVAALYVLIHHIWLTVWPIQYNRFPGQGPVQSLTTWLIYGHFSVTVFIVISGFCLGLPIARKGTAGWHGALNFYLRRARRILPPYYASLILTVLLTLTVLGAKTGTLWDVNLPLNFGKAAWSLVLLNDIFGVNQINGVYWSIALECQIYVIFPLLVFIWLRKGVGWAAALGIALGYAVAFEVRHAKLVGFAPQFLAMFAMGFCVAYAYRNPGWRKKTERIPWALISFLIFAVLAIYLRTAGLAKVGPKYYIFDLPMGIAAASLIMAGCQGNRRLNAFLCSRPMLWVGAFSYSLYLIHLPVIQLVWQYAIRPFNFPDWAQFLTLLIVGAAAAVGAAWLFYMLIERHFDPAAKKRAAVEHLAA
jgi:peptidoglycan/LPS O-acetylase OafA/YrhL